MDHDSYNIVCNIPKETEYYTEIRKLSENEKTISFLMGVNSLMTIKKSNIFDKDENTDALIKAHYEDIIKGKEIELNITKNIYNEEKDKLRKETKEEYEMRYNDIMKKNEDCNTKIHELEKELVLKEENLRHVKEINKNFIEIEVNNILKEKEHIYIQTIDEYKNKLNEFEKEKYKIKEETKEYYEIQYQEKEKELQSKNEIYKKNTINNNIFMDNKVNEMSMMINELLMENSQLKDKIKYLEDKISKLIMQQIEDRKNKLKDTTNI